MAAKQINTPIYDIRFVHRAIKRQHIVLSAIGNSNRTSRELAVDLINASGQSWAFIANGAMLSKSTVKNLATEKTKRPQSETTDRIIRYFNYGINLKPTMIKFEFENKPKVK